MAIPPDGWLRPHSFVFVFLLVSLLSFFFFFLVFRDRVSLCSPGCPGTYFVDQADLELRNPPASASRVLGLKACATRPLLVSLNLRPCPHSLSSSPLCSRVESTPRPPPPSLRPLLGPSLGQGPGILSWCGLCLYPQLETYLFQSLTSA
jgi:hypothetical protein